MKVNEITTNYLEKNTNCHVQGKREQLNAVVEAVKKAFASSQNELLIEVSCNQGQTGSMHMRYFKVWKAVVEQLMAAVEGDFADKELFEQVEEVFADDNYDDEDIDYMEFMYALFESVQNKNIHLILKDFDYFKEIFPEDEKDEEIGFPFGALFGMSKTKVIEAPGNLTTMILSTNDYSEIVHHLQRYYDSFWQHAYEICQVEA